MRSELDRLGVHTRGEAMSISQLVRLLRDHGYDVSDKPAPRNPIDPDPSSDR